MLSNKTNIYVWVTNSSNSIIWLDKNGKNIASLIKSKIKSLLVYDYSSFIQIFVRQ